MVMFHSCVSLPKGNSWEKPCKNPWQPIDISHGLYALVVARNHETDRVQWSSSLTISIGTGLAGAPKHVCKESCFFDICEYAKGNTMVLHTFEITLVCSTCQKLKHPLTVAVGPSKQVIQVFFLQTAHRRLGMTPTTKSDQPGKQKSPRSESSRAKMKPWITRFFRRLLSALPKMLGFDPSSSRKRTVP